LTVIKEMLETARGMADSSAADYNRFANKCRAAGMPPE